MIHCIACQAEESESRPMEAILRWYYCAGSPKCEEVASLVVELLDFYGGNTQEALAGLQAFEEVRR